MKDVGVSSKYWPAAGRLCSSSKNPGYFYSKFELAPPAVSHLWKTPFILACWVSLLICRAQCSVERSSAPHAVGLSSCRSVCTCAPSAQLAHRLKIDAPKISSSAKQEASALKLLSFLPPSFFFPSTPPPPPSDICELARELQRQLGKEQGQRKKKRRSMWK